MSDDMQADRRKAPKNSKVSLARLRLSTSCTECHKRKQKCDQNQPCRNCSRRFPPVECVYRSVSGGNAAASRMIAVPQYASQEETGQQLLRDVTSLDNPNRGISSSFITTLASSTQLLAPRRMRDTREWAQSDPYFEQPDVLDAGTSYQQLLNAMISSIPEPIDFDSYLSHDSNLNSGSGSPLTEDEILDLDGALDIQRTQNLRWAIWYSRMNDTIKPCFNIISVDPLHYLPIKPTIQNGELFQLFVKLITKFVVSIDGNPSPNYYNDQWIPWSVKSPLLAQIGIYTASCYQAEAQKIPAGQSQIAIGHKLKSISILNDMLRSHDKSTCDEAVAAVVYFTTNEWYWGGRENVHAHLGGLQEMIRLRGGLDIEGMNGFLRKMVILCDYHIACSYDHEPCFEHKLASPTVDTGSPPYPAHMATPLVDSRLSFTDNLDKLPISNETGMILDDMRFLTMAIGQQIEVESTRKGEEKMKLLAIWVRDRTLASPNGNESDGPLSNDHIYKCCRKVALVYCQAIVNRCSLAQACTMQDLNQLWASMWRITLTQWKRIPGIFIWVLLAVNPAAQNTPHGRLLKSLLKSASLYVALEHWEVIDESLMSFIRLQRWLRGGMYELANISNPNIG